MENIKDIIAFIEEKDYARRIFIAPYEDALSFAKSAVDANGGEGTEEEIAEYIDYISDGGKLKEDSVMFYVVPGNGDGRAFIYSPSDHPLNWTSKARVVAASAYLYAYDEEIEIPEGK